MAQEKPTPKPTLKAKPKETSKKEMDKQLMAELAGQLGRELVRGAAEKTKEWIDTSNVEAAKKALPKMKKWDRVELARNTKNPIILMALTALTEDEHVISRLEALDNPNMPLDGIRNALKRGNELDYLTLASLAGKTKNLKILKFLAEKGDDHMVLRALDNPNIPLAVIKKAVKQMKFVNRLLLARLSKNPTILKELAKDEDYEVTSEVLLNVHTPHDIQMKLWRGEKA